LIDRCVYYLNSNLNICEQICLNDELTKYWWGPWPLVAKVDHVDWRNQWNQDEESVD